MDNEQECSDGGPAFPLGSGSWGDPIGMAELNLRDYFAAAAVQGVLASDINNSFTMERIAMLAYVQADAMLKVRQQPNA